MTPHFSPTTLKKMTKADLLEMVNRLQLQNDELQQKVQQAERVDHRTDEMLQAIRLRCEKHRDEKNRLKQLDRILNVAYMMVLGVSLFLFLYSTILAFDEYGAPGIGVRPKYLSTNFKWLVDDKIGSILLGILGFSISIPSQITFPAPYRSFATVTLFAIKQIIILFLPKWCICIVTLFAILAIYTLDLDRKNQVSSFST